MTPSEQKKYEIIDFTYRHPYNSGIQNLIDLILYCHIERVVSLEIKCIGLPDNYAMITKTDNDQGNRVLFIGS